MASLAQQAPARERINTERVVPGEAPPYLLQKHVSRYAFIRDAVRGKQVLEMGSGDGYGAYHLAHFARKLIGTDISTETVARARERYQHPNLAFMAMDSTNLVFPAEHFDVAYSFEVIEHVPDPDKFIAESHRVLRPDGAFFISTPNTHSYVAAGQNAFHETEYTLLQFYKLLTRHYPVVEIYGQFCRQPLRERLYRLSSKLYFSSRAYRRLLFAVAPYYINLFWGRRETNRIDWVDSAQPDLFEFRNDDPELSDSFLAVCRKQPEMLARS